jgi:hypothetical protein
MASMFKLDELLGTSKDQQEQKRPLKRCSPVMSDPDGRPWSA